jgi:hypothetical protein
MSMGYIYMSLDRKTLNRPVVKGRQTKQMVDEKKELEILPLYY